MQKQDPQRKFPEGKPDKISMDILEERADLDNGESSSDSGSTPNGQAATDQDGAQQLKD